jgi:protein-disulfide isomerase
MLAACRPFRIACVPPLASALALSLVLLLSCSAVAAAPTPAAATDTSAEWPGHRAIATIGNARITAADVVAQEQGAFDRLQADHDLKLRQLRRKHEQARYELLEEHLRQLLDKKALELEANARGMSTEALLATIKVPAVTDEEVREYYETNKARTNQTFAELRSQITQYLADEHNANAVRGFYDALRAQHGIASLLEPYRVAVAATGPARGKDQAAITVVEFGDFQCTYCRQAEDTLRQVLTRHPDEVRLVFRHLPLPGVHPNAAIAARAGVCADRQGMFWAMHDAMYEDQGALGEGALKDTARRLGLNTDGFSTCLAESSTQQTVDADSRAAQELGIGGTPHFFINGRPLSGSVPEDRFESIILDELHRRGAKRG